MAELPCLLTLEEAAAALHQTVTISTLRSEIRSGRLPKRQIGKRYYLTPDDLWRLTWPDRESLPDSTSDATKVSGLSETAPPSTGRALASSSAERLKALSRNTSRPAERPSGAVLQIHRS